MGKLYYVGLEAYNSRYTLQLTEWNRVVFEKNKLDVVYVKGQTLNNDMKISVGQVLDAHGRSYFALSQMMNLVSMMQQGLMSSSDVIYFEDMFHPGFESLGYVINQVPKDQVPRIFVRCLAQAIDPDDFVHVWGMSNWMHHYEMMVNDIVSYSSGAVLASSEEMVMNMKIANWTANIYNISGLAFNKEEVLSRVKTFIPFENRKMRVAFSSRWDQEKQPDFYMDLIERVKSTEWGKQIEFAIFSGDTLKSNCPECLDRAKRPLLFDLLRD
jgi:hypothetical protein